MAPDQLLLQHFSRWASPAAEHSSGWAQGAGPPDPRGHPQALWGPGLDVLPSPRSPTGGRGWLLPMGLVPRCEAAWAVPGAGCQRGARINPQP